MRVKWIIEPAPTEDEPNPPRNRAVCNDCGAVHKRTAQLIVGSRILWQLCQPCAQQLQSLLYDPDPDATDREQLATLGATAPRHWGR